MAQIIPAIAAEPTCKIQLRDFWIAPYIWSSPLQPTQSICNPPHSKGWKQTKCFQAHRLQCQTHSELICIKASSFSFGEGTSENNLALIDFTFFPAGPMSPFHVHVSISCQTFLPAIYFTKKSKALHIYRVIFPKDTAIYRSHVLRGCKLKAHSPLTAAEIHWHDTNWGLTLCLGESRYLSPSGVPSSTALQHPGKTSTILISRECCNFSSCDLKSLALRG